MTDDELPPWLSDLRSFSLQMPLFVAWPVKELVDDFSGSERGARLALLELCEVVEALTKTLAAAAGADLASEGTPHWLASIVATHLSMPTFGRWWRLLDLIAKKGGTPMLPELPAAVQQMRTLLFASPSTDQRPEWSNILDVRNPLAHGAGIDAKLAQKLLAHWGPRVSEAAHAAAFLGGIDCWVHDPDGFRRLNGAEINPALEVPPDIVRKVLSVGDVALVRSGRVVILSPLGRRASLNIGERVLSQLYVRQGEVGLVYGLFGSEDALQTESEAGLRDRFEALFDITSIRRRHAERGFIERGYESEFESDARGFVGRADAVETLWRAVESRGQGVVFVSGPAGIGKSRLVARVIFDLVAELAERTRRGVSRETIFAYRFTDRDRGCAPLPFLRWLVERLGRITEKETSLSSDHTLEALLDIAANLVASSPLDRIVLILDGLDELARGFPRFASDIVLRLGPSDRLILLVASRPEAGIPDAMAAANAFLPWPDGLPPMSGVELREMLVTLLPRAAKLFVREDKVEGDRVRNRFIDVMVERAAGLPLYVTLLVQAAHEPGFDPEQLARPGWLPRRVTSFFDRLVERGVLSGDKGYYTQLVGALLALAREPLSLHEISAVLSGGMTLAQRADIYRRYGIDPSARNGVLAEEILRDLGGLLRVAVDESSTRRYRLLHDDLTTFIRASPAFGVICTTVRTWLAEQSRAPDGDAARYLFANGIAHLLDGETDDGNAVELAGACLADMDYQLGRLSLLARSGGDGGIRDDWNLVLDRGVLRQGSHRAWRHFWTTEGSHLAIGPARDGAREFLEIALQYAPDTVVGAAATPFLPTDS
ncbi:AAA family ATPase [Mesorhizobium escarrei]|uniref:NACHT domain-containing protein n=1 Tax=Mesorhizobium escarrei TaxID=666018 RepID=A0ABM9E8U2_9HYPH|nr:AAA family ATPase [Mesorhizobium escarrei]CAH2405593.1 hypothetical protein MES5069_480008 [Mesorhizobium escarrei]